MIKKLMILLGAMTAIYLFTAVALILAPVNQTPSERNLDLIRQPPQNEISLTPIDENYVARDGAEIYCPYLQGDSDIVVVLIHGAGSDGTYLLPLAERLNASTNATVVIPDLRGHGRSSLANKGDVDYVGQLEHDLEDLNAALRLKYPDAKIILGGHASGGGLAVRYGGSQLAEFDGYLLLAPYLGYDAPTVRADYSGWAVASTRRYLGLAMLNHVGITGLNGMPVLFFNHHDAGENLLQVESYTYRMSESFTPQSYDSDLQSNHKSILTLIGNLDELFDADQFEAVFRENAPHAELHIIPNTMHLDLVSQPEVINLTIRWVEEINRSPSSNFSN